MTQDGNGRVSFSYVDDYRKQPDPTPLSQIIGFDSRAHKPSQVRNWFDGLLPDSSAVREEWGRKYHVSARNPLSLLRHVGRDAAGAVQVLSPDESADDAASRTGDIQWLTDDEFESLLDDLSTRRGDWGREFRNGRWSLAGAQNKVALFHDRGRWGIPLDSTPTTHIIKTSIDGFDLHDVNEFAAQRAAQSLGIPAADTTLLIQGGARAVVSTRYDRLYVDGRWRRIHQEDLCQALGTAPDLKYQSDGGPGIADARRVFERMGARAERERAASTFFDYMIYNVVIGATDAHAKNFSILHAGSASRLAPLYDTASFLPYVHEPIRTAGLREDLPRSAMKIGSTYELSKIAVSDIAKVARTLGLDPNAGVDRFRDLAARVPGAFEEVAATLDDAEHAQFIRDLSGKIATHVARR